MEVLNLFYKRYLYLPFVRKVFPVQLLIFLFSFSFISSGKAFSIFVNFPEANTKIVKEIDARFRDLTHKTGDAKGFNTENTTTYTPNDNNKREVSGSPKVVPVNVEPICLNLGDKCSGNSQEIQSYNLNLPQGGKLPVTFTYRSHEGYSSCRIRINGGNWQSFLVDKTSADLSYYSISIGSFTFSNGSNSIELASEGGYICFRELCVGGDGCFPPATPKITVGNSSSLGESKILTGSGCAGIGTWSHGLGTGSTVIVNPTVTTTYTATCTIGNCTSPEASITIEPSKKCFPLNDLCSGNSQEIQSYNISPESGGNLVSKLTYRSHEKDGIVRMRINGGEWQSFNVKQTPTDLSFAEIQIGPNTYQRSGNRIEFASGDGYICFRELCLGDVAPDCNFSAKTDPAVIYTTPHSPSPLPITLTSSCEGSGCSGVSYQWSGNGANCNTPNCIVSPNNPGTYIYTVRLSKSGCNDQTAQVTVIVNLPFITCFSFPLGDQCSGNSQEIRSYDINQISGVNLPVTLTYRSHERPGIVRIRINGGNWHSFNVDQTPGDLSYSKVQIGPISFQSGNNKVELASGEGFVCFRELCVGIPGVRIGLAEEREAENQELVLAPNPNNGQFEASFYVEPGRKAVLNVSDMQGREVWRKDLNGEGLQRETVQLPAQAVGSYIMLLRKEATSSTGTLEYKKVIVVK